MPWDYSVPLKGDKGVPNLPSPEGAALGIELARMLAPNLAMVKANFPKSLPMCDECLCRAGTVANQCESTLMDFVKCTAENEPFYCHKGIAEDAKPRRLCAGYVAAISTARTSSQIRADVSKEPQR